jgi:hypothetical protein
MSGKPRAHCRDAHPLVLSLPTGSALAHEDVDGKPVATGHVPKTQPFSFSADEGTDVGIDNETAASTDYERAPSKFTGQIESVTIAVSPSKLTAVDRKAVDDAGEAADKAHEVPELRELSYSLPRRFRIPTPSPPPLRSTFLIADAPDCERRLIDNE